jgi:hypothetical protein
VFVRSAGLPLTFVGIGLALAALIAAVTKS